MHPAAYVMMVALVPSVVTEGTVLFISGLSFNIS